MEISPTGPITDLAVIPSGDHFLAFSTLTVNPGKPVTEIYKEKLDSCEKYSSCETCLADGADPLCGWCMKSGKCSTKSTCQGFFKERSQLHIKQEIPQCPKISGADELRDYSIENYKPENGLEMVVENLPGCKGDIHSCYQINVVQCRYQIGKQSLGHVFF